MKLSRKNKEEIVGILEPIINRTDSSESGVALMQKVVQVTKGDVEKHHFFQVEEFILGHLMYEAKRQNSDNIFDVFDSLPNDAFSSPINKSMYQSMKGVFAEKGRLDTVVLVSELTKAKKIDEVGGGARIIELSAKHNQTTNLQTLSKELNEEYRRKELISRIEHQIVRLRQKDFTSVDSVIGEIDGDIYALSERKTQTIVDIPKVAEKLIERANSVERYGLIGRSWGIGTLDIVTGGVERKKSYVIGAVKKAGKSKMLINTAHHLNKQNVKTLVLSMEMGAEAMVGELLSREAEESNNKLKANLSNEVEEKFRSVSKKMDNIIIDTQSFLTVNQIRNKIRAASQRGVEVVMLDYIQRMNFEYGGGANKGRNDASIIASAIARIADFAREYDVAIIMLSQLANRAEKNTPSVSDLKDSGGIGEAVDCIILIDNEDRRNGNYGLKTNVVNLLVEQRNGASGMIETVVDLSISKYLDKADPRPEDFTFPERKDLE